MKNKKTECTGLSWGDLLILLDRLKKEKDYRFMLFISIGSYSGLRISDILRLEWKDIVDKKELEITEAKTGKFRRISINETLEEVIQFCFSKIVTAKNRNTLLSNLVFANRWGNQMTVQYINRKLHEVFERNHVKVQNGSSHTLRKTFGKRVFELAGKTEASLILLSQIFNHSSTSITRRYIGIVDEQIQKAYLSL